MDISDVIAEKNGLEREIYYFIKDKIKEFEEKTGVKIDDMRLKLNTVEDDYGKERKEIEWLDVIVIL